MHKKITLQQGVELAVHHPQKGASILASTISKTLNAEKWIDDKTKLRFCIMFASNLLDGHIEKEIGKERIEKIKKLPFRTSLRLFKSDPEDGLKCLVAISAEEVRENQKLSMIEQVKFTDDLFKSFFPNIDFQKLRK